MGPPLKALVEDAELKDRVKVVFKHYPLNFHKQAEPAALASIAAHEQGKFWEMHDKIFEGQKDISPEKLEEWAKAIGLDMDKYKASIASDKTKAALKADMDEANKAGIRGTPSFYINGRKYEGGGFTPDALKPIFKKYFPKP